MFDKRKKYQFLSREFQWIWAALAFQAGFVNAGGFLACARFVSHMTGFGTQVGLSVSDLDYDLAIEMLSAPASFLLGAMVSALAVDRPMIRGDRPNYLAVMFGIVLIYVFVTTGGILGLFGVFGEPLLLARDFLLMSLLCFACGLQNACFASLTGGQIRTTHLTGILTDIGTTFIKLFYIRNRQTVIMQRTNNVRVLIFVSFSLGSMVSAVLFRIFEYAGFGFLVASSTFLLVVAFYKTHYATKRSRELNKIFANFETSKELTGPAAQ